MSQSDIYLENAKRVVQNAEKGIGTATFDKPCAKCLHLDRSFLSFLDFHRKCSNPIVVLAASQVNPSSREYLSAAEYQRSNKGVWGPIVCGPNATLFEER